VLEKVAASCDEIKQAFARSKFSKPERIGRKPTPMSPKLSTSAIFTLQPCDNSGHLTAPRRSPVNRTFSIGGRVASGDYCTVDFPLAILTGMTTAAIVAGNAVIIKPSDQTPVIGARLMELFLEAGLPAGVVNLLIGPGSKVGAHLVGHPQVDFIAFTGSKEVGLKIWETAGHTHPGQRNLKKVICEMGGKNCLIVDSDADLDEAVIGCIASAFGYLGQKCSALSRLIVLADNYDKFLERLVSAAASLPVGIPELPGTIIGPVISRDAQQRISQ